MSEPVAPTVSSTDPAAISRRSTHGQRVVIGISVGLVAVVGAGFGRVVQGTSSKTLAASSTERTIETTLHQRLRAFGADRPLNVTCPSEPEKAGKVFACSVTGLTETPYHHIQVTETNANDGLRLLLAP